jgi:hypothetical protein
MNWYYRVAFNRSAQGIIQNGASKDSSVSTEDVYVDETYPVIHETTNSIDILVKGSVINVVKNPTGKPSIISHYDIDHDKNIDDFYDSIAGWYGKAIAVSVKSSVLEYLHSREEIRTGLDVISRDACHSNPAMAKLFILSYFHRLSYDH